MENYDVKALMDAKIPGEETGIEIKKGICGFCGDSCLVDVYMKEGKVIKVEGTKDLPGSNGKLCSKGAALKQALYNPERLLYPMKRVGKRGEGKFERITWDEALTTIADKMKETKEKMGAKHTMIYVAHPKWFRPQATELANGYGTPNYGTESSTCAYALMMAVKSSYGANQGMLAPDVRNCKAHFIWGVNPMHSRSVSGSGMILNNIKRGMKLVVIDPRCTPTTEHADIHLRPIPGTDGALAHGMARVLITENLYDKEYVEKYTIGFEEYKNYVMEFTPEKVEAITGVPKEDMIAAARLMGEMKPCPIQMSASPVVHNINGVQNARAVTLLLALTGSFGVKGGSAAPGGPMAMLKGRFAPNGKIKRVDAENDLSHNDFPAWAKLSSHEIQVTKIADYLLGKGEYPIETLVAFGMNHHMWPRVDRVEEALESIGFVANADIYMTESCKYADIVLPVQSSLEREQVEVLGGKTLFYQGHVVEPMGEAKTDMDIICALAEKLGFVIGGDEPIHNHEDYLRKAISPTGVTLEELKANPMGVEIKNFMPAKTTEDILKVQTPSGKIEFVSSVIASCDKEGHEGLPVFHDFREKLPMDEYPLILATGSRKPHLFHSRSYRQPWLANLEKYPLVEIHPSDAEKLGMVEGEEVVIKTPMGSMDITVRITSSNLPGVVNVYHALGDVDINYIMDDTYLDPISGFPGYKSYCCRLEKKGE
ncbi:MAG: molybdopterin-dependent oxidoreductase [Clostridia bacterium]|nr:molybdopterin-dependent oxidoreductase [Clostridia bacterium]